MQIQGTELHIKYSKNKWSKYKYSKRKLKTPNKLKSSPDLKRPGLRPGRAADGGRRGHRGIRPCRCGGSCDWNKLFIVFVSVVSINYTTIFHVKIRFVHCITILIFDPTFHVTENKQDLILSILRSSISNVGTATSHLNQLRQDKHLSFWHHSSSQEIKHFYFFSPFEQHNKESSTISFKNRDHLCSRTCLRFKMAIWWFGIPTRWLDLFQLICMSNRSRFARLARLAAFLQKRF